MQDGLIINDNILVAYTARETEVIVPDGVHIIGAGAFKSCTSLLKVVLPDTITEIREHAFKGCRQLAQINFPSQLSVIGDYAFHRCHALKQVKLPSSVMDLGNCSFLFCDHLEMVSLPGVKKLSKQAFLNDALLTELELSKELDVSSICDVFTSCANISVIRLTDGTITKIDDPIQMLSTSSKVNPIAKAVVTDIYRMMVIEDGILKEFTTNIKHVEVTEGIIALGKSCFFNKKGVISVKLPQSLKEIGSRAFRNCINLERVELGNDTMSICEDAFKNCTTLRYIVMPDGTEYELVGLPDDSIFPPIVTKIQNQVLGNFLICGKVLLEYRGVEERVVIPEGITVIAERAFAGNEAIGKVILPESVVKIGDEAFADCLLLQTITVSENLTYLGKAVFKGCVKLIRIYLPKGIYRIKNSCFYGCKKLMNVEVSDWLETIEDMAFYGCLSLIQIAFPKNLKKIGDMAFYQCHAFRNVTLHSMIVGNRAFSLSGVQKVTMESDITNEKGQLGGGNSIFSNCKGLKTIIFQDGVTSVGNKFAFQCERLKEVDLPSSVQSVGAYAFEGSAFINNLPKTGIFHHILLDGSEYEGDLVIPDSVGVIVGGAFYENDKILSVTLPNSIKSVGEQAFFGCKMLRKVVWTETTCEIAPRTFAYCVSLEEMIIKGQIRKVSTQAFFGCRSLKSILLNGENSKILVEEQAFCDCIKLKDVEIDSMWTPSFGVNSFRNTPFLDELVHKNILAVIDNVAIDGINCKGIVQIPDGIQEVSPYAFWGNEEITEIFLPNSLLWIGEGAFSGCKRLKAIHLPSNIQVVHKKAFEKCSSLEKVSGYAKEVCEGAFSYCIQLTHVELHASKIGKQAFCGCKNLISFQCNNTVEFGNGCFMDCNHLERIDFSNVQKIGECAFQGCDSLKQVTLFTHIPIGNHAFMDCGRLEEVKWIKHVGDSNESLYFMVCHNIFSGCTALQRIVIDNRFVELNGYMDLFHPDLPEKARELYASAMSCFSIDEKFSLMTYKNKGRIVHIPEGVVRIESEVFRDMVQIDAIVVPESVQYIGARAFYGTSWLDDEIRKNHTNGFSINQIVVDGTGCQGELRIEESIRIVSGWAFANCYDITGIVFASTDTIVEEYAFRNCINLSYVIEADGKKYELTCIQDCERDLPPRIKQIFVDCYNCFKMDDKGRLIESTGNISNLVLANGIREIADRVFLDSNLLSRIVLSKDTICIGANAFQSCKWLVSVENAVSVERIEEKAFFGCGRLSRIELSDTLSFIGKGAFEHCMSLEEIVIPEGIEEIPERAFFRCSSLLSIKLPSTLKKIGKEAFAFCKGLKTVYFHKNDAIFENNVNSKKDSMIENRIEHTMEIEERAFFGNDALVWSNYL